MIYHKMAQSDYMQLNQQKFCQYHVLYNYTPPDDYLDQGYLVIEEGDIIQVPRPVQLESGSEENPDGWLKGKNTRNGLEGYFPAGKFVLYIPEKAVTVPPVAISRSGGSLRRHCLTEAFFVRPILCSCCEDYIWGVDEVGVTCKDCCQCFHTECESIAVSFTTCNKSPPAKPPQIFDRPIHLSQWDINNIADWMAAVNLHRYAHVFMKHDIKGSSLREVNETKLCKMKIEDEFHKNSILACIDKLCSGRRVDPVCMVEPEGASKSDHRFVVYSFSSMQPCHLCSEYLWGLLQQGYQCRDCGLCCHRKCSVGNLPKCRADQMVKLRRASFELNTVFGIQLSEQFLVSLTKTAPPVVMHFTKELERRAEQSGAKVLDAYRSTAKTGDINCLKKLLSEVEEPNLEKFDVVCIAGSLKKFLRDLPNAVIHEDFYARFIQESKIPDNEECKKSLLRLVDELPLQHRSTLQHLLGHFKRCAQLQGLNDAGIRDVVSKLARVFWQILIRPPWHNIMDIVFNAENSLRVVTLLLQSVLPCPPAGGIGGPVKKSFNRKKPEPPAPVIPVHDPPVMICGEDVGSIEDADWYWKDISKEEINEKMSNTQNGTFLVRNSSDGVKDNYTLVLRMKGSNRLLRIYHRDGKFGLMEPLIFTSVVELINYYMRNSLIHFNKALDTELLYPVLRPADTDEVDLKSLKEAFVKIDQEYNDDAKKFERVHEEHQRITEDLQLRHQALEAYKETMIMFEESVKLVVKNERLVPQGDVARARNNFELLKRQLRSVVESYTKLESEMKEQTAASKIRFKEMNAMKPDLQAKGELRDQLRQKLLKAGETHRVLELLVNNEESRNKIEESSLHEDEATWLVECDRNQALELLTGKPDGTFLIRPRNEPENPYVLSIVSGNEIVHCKIGKKATGYGFADPFFIHETLKDLVLHYRDTSLVEHNDVLDVMLQYPIHSKLTALNASTRIPPPAPARQRRENHESYVS